MKVQNKDFLSETIIQDVLFACTYMLQPDSNSGLIIRGICPRVVPNSTLPPFSFIVVLFYLCPQKHMIIRKLSCMDV